MENVIRLIEGEKVKHIQTSKRGVVRGRTTENGNEKIVVYWKDGRISYVSEENLCRTDV